MIILSSSRSQLFIHKKMVNTLNGYKKNHMQINKIKACQKSFGKWINIIYVADQFIIFLFLESLRFLLHADANLSPCPWFVIYWSTLVLCTHTKQKARMNSKRGMSWIWKEICIIGLSVILVLAWEFPITITINQTSLYCIFCWTKGTKTRRKVPCEFNWSWSLSWQNIVSTKVFVILVPLRKIENDKNAFGVSS